MNLFAYGSLVSPASLAATIGAPVPVGRGPLPAVLGDHAREWIVGSDRESHPERVLVAEDGSVFGGTLAVLGIRAAAGAVCTGAVYELDDAVVASLSLRERNYTLVEVSVQVDGGRRPRPVVTFVPRPGAVERLRRARLAGTAVVRAGYADLVADAFRQLGPGQAEAYLRTTVPHGLPVRGLRVAG